MSRLLQILLLLIPALFISGCLQGDKSEKPPVHLNPNMDTQEKYKPYKESSFFANKSAMRMPVEGTIALGDLFEDTIFYYGKTDDGTFVDTNPTLQSPKQMRRGEKNYDVFCTPCHGNTGDGMGLIIKYVYPPATSMHSNRVKDMPDGQIFSVITNGNVLMPSYKHQITVEDRWAIIYYIRQLQTQ